MDILTEKLKDEIDIGEMLTLARNENNNIVEDYLEKLIESQI